LDSVTTVDVFGKFIIIMSNAKIPLHMVSQFAFICI